MCDADVDGDGLLNGVDLDNDNDGVPDASEPGGDEEAPNAYDPDRDDDGIRDGLDGDNADQSNVCDPDAGAPVDTPVGNITSLIQCAAPEGVILKSTTHVMGRGHLQIITPKAADVEAGFSVAPGGKVSVHTEELPTP